jgi:uncharacterized membrane protein
MIDCVVKEELPFFIKVSVHFLLNFYLGLNGWYKEVSYANIVLQEHFLGILLFLVRVVLLIALILWLILKSLFSLSYQIPINQILKSSQPFSQSLIPCQTFFLILIQQTLHSV